MHRAFDDWNRALRFESPSLSQLAAISGWAEPMPVFPHSHLLWLVGPNLAAFLDPMQAPPGHVTGPVKRIILVLTSTFFASTATVQTEDLPPFRMLGLSLPCNAVQLRAHLQLLGGTLEVYTEAAQIRMVFEGRTEFCLEPTNGTIIQTPEQTQLVTVENIYQPDATGRPALITG